MEITETPTFYTISDFAKVCGVTPTAIALRKKRGQLPSPAARTAGGRDLWTIEQVLHLKAEREEKERTGRNPFKALGGFK